MYTQIPYELKLDEAIETKFIKALKERLRKQEARFMLTRLDNFCTDDVKIWHLLTDCEPKVLSKMLHEIIEKECD